MAILIGATAAQALELPQREGPRPQTTTSVPHIQLGAKNRRDLTEAVLAEVAKFPGVSLGETRISLPGAIGFQLNQGVSVARPKAIVGGREFAHMHPDGSLHAALDPAVARSAIAKGWAIPHPWSAQRDGWEGFVMIYSPTTQAEARVVLVLLRNSFEYVTGQSL